MKTKPLTDLSIADLFALRAESQNIIDVNKGAYTRVSGNHYPTTIEIKKNQYLEKIIDLLNDEIIKRAKEFNIDLTF